MGMPSMPGAPLLAFTRFHAVRRLSLESTAAINSFVSTSFRVVLVQGSVRVVRRLAFPVWGCYGYAEIAPSAPCVSLFDPSPRHNRHDYYDRC